MALFKQVWTFQSGTAFWSDVWYRVAGNLAAAAEVPNQVFNTRMRLANPLTKLQKCITSSLTTSRATIVQTVNQYGIPPDEKGDDFPANQRESITCTIMSTVDGVKRKWWCRGVNENASQRRQDNGDWELKPEFAQKLKAFITLMSQRQYAIKSYMRGDQPQVEFIRVTAVDGTAGTGQSLLTLTKPLAEPFASKYNFTKFNQKSLPGLKGSFRVLVRIGEKYLINYATPSNTLVQANDGFISPLLLREDCLFKAEGSNYEFTSARDTKNVDTGSRGAQRAPRVRSLS